MQGEFQKDLFDESNVENYFCLEYVDTDFLNEIPNDKWVLTIKWYEFIVEYLRNNIPVVRELVLALFVYPNDDHSKKQDRWDAANNAVHIIKEQYPKIPWRKSENNIK
jgi:hypothetical protein